MRVGNRLSAEQIRLPKAARCADDFEQQLARVSYANAELARCTDLNMYAGFGIKQPDFAVRAPFDAHLGGEVDEVDLGMERTLGISRELVDLLQQRQLLCLQRIAARAKEVERLPVAEENGLLTLMDDQLRTEIEVLDRVLPDERFVVALIFDDAGKAVLFDLLGHGPLLNVVFAAADRADADGVRLARVQLDAALRAGELHGLELQRCRVDRLVADRAERLFALGLVIDDRVAAFRAFAGRQFFCAHVDRVAACALDLPFCKQAGAGLSVIPTFWAFNDKFAHIIYPLLFVWELNICPVGNVTLTVVVVSDCDNGAI